MKKKIAYIISRFPTVSETFILYEMIELTRLGMEIEVFPLIHEKGSIIHSEVESIAQNVHYPKLFSIGTLRDHFFWFLKKPVTYLQTIIQALGKNLRSLKFLSRAVVVVLLSAQVARKVEQLGTQHIHAHSATHPTLMAYIVHKLTGLPYSFTAHSSDIYFNQTMLSEKIRHACFLVTISNYNVDFLKRLSPEVPTQKIHVIHCGIDPAKFKIKPAKQLNKSFKIICVGRLEKVKGHQYLIEACARLQAWNIDFHCYLVGDGELQSEVQQEIDQLGLSQQVELLGFQTHDKVVELLGQVDILALPSLSEGIPVAVMEGMASELPIVATAVTGVPELVENGITGLLVPIKNSLALAEALQKLCNSPDLRLQMGRSGRKKVLKEFNLQNSAVQLYNIFIDS